MTDIQTLPSSLGTVGFVISLMAGTLTPPDRSADQIEQAAPLIRYDMLHSTYGSNTSIFVLSNVAETTSAKGALESFFEDLLSKQQRLGPEFEQVLFDNLWTLYAR